MPTGYTEIIEKGCTFREYAMRCARAFGWFVRMRDTSLDSPIPDEIKPEEYHLREKEVAEVRLAELMHTRTEDAAGDARREFNKAIETYRNYQIEARELEQKYATMLAQVEKWTPPTRDHASLKDFMIEQINLCKHGPSDYYPKPVLLTGEEWLTREVQSAQRDIDYHSQHYAKEVQFCADATVWLAELKSSLSEKDGE